MKKAITLSFIIVLISMVFNTASAQHDTILFVGDTVILTVTGANGSIQWQQSTDGLAWSDISGATNTTVEIESTASPTGERYFRAAVTDILCPDSTPWYSNKIRNQIVDNTTLLQTGDWFHGGIIFYTDGFGNGLIVTETDQGMAQWGCDGNKINGTTDADGKANTDTIVNYHNAIGYYGDPQQCNFANDGTVAAKVCQDLDLNNYSDWFLPSKDAIAELYSARASVGTFQSDYYWSSTENTNNWAYAQDFDEGYLDPMNKSESVYLRCTRSYNTTPPTNTKIAYTVSVPNQPATVNITSQPVSQNICKGNNVTFSITASGTTPFS